jgi:hypothetical protein
LPNVTVARAAPKVLPRRQFATAFAVASSARFAARASKEAVG